MSNLNPSSAHSEDKKFLVIAVQLLFVVAPFQTLMIVIGATLLPFGTILGAIIGAVGIVLLAFSRIGLSLNSDRPIVYAFLFVAIGILSTAFTDYGLPAMAKGAINLSAMLAMVAMALVVVRILTNRPRLFQHLVRIMTISTGVAGLTVIFQFFVVNLLQLPELFDLRFLNEFWGGDWWHPAAVNGFTRPQGIYLEPSFIAGFISTASGVAMMRLGILGQKWRSGLTGIVPTWAAISILGSQVLSLSAVVYVTLLVAFVGTFASNTRIQLRSVLPFIVGTALACTFLILLVLQAGDAVLGRLSGLALFGQLANVEDLAKEGDPINFTVIVLFLNAYVGLQNVIAHPLLGAGVGAHPFAYDALTSAVPVMNEQALGLSSMDGGALIIRLISETGILGTLLFTAAIISSWLRVRRTILNTHMEPSNAVQLSFSAMAMGVGGGMAGVFAGFLLHIGHYYDPQFWGLFAMCVAVPAVAPAYRQNRVGFGPLGDES